MGGGTRYSTSETEIGTWIDGSKLYRKVWRDTLKFTSTADIKTISLGISTAKIRRIEGYSFRYYGTDAQMMPIAMSAGTYGGSALYMTNAILQNSELNLACGGNFINSDLDTWIIYEYTK